MDSATIEEIQQQLRAVRAELAEIAAEYDSGEPMSDEELDEVRERIRQLDDDKLLDTVLVSVKGAECGWTRKLRQAATMSVSELIQRFVPWEIAGPAFDRYENGSALGGDGRS